MDEKAQRNVIVFNQSKNEIFSPNNGLKTLNRKLRSTWKIQRYNGCMKINQELLIYSRMWLD